MPDFVALMKRATLARREGRLSDARRDFAAAVSSCRLKAAPRELVRSLKGVAQIERDKGRADAAVPFYEEAVAVCRQGRDVLGLAHTIRHLGDAHYEAGRLDLAETCLREALELYRGHDVAPLLDLANAIRPLALLEGALGRRVEAVRLWEEASDLYAAVGVQEGVDESAAHIARLSQ